MAKVGVIFTKNFAGLKKDDAWECDSLLASSLVKRKVAKYSEAHIAKLKAIEEKGKASAKLRKEQEAKLAAEKKAKIAKAIKVKEKLEKEGK